MRSKLVQRKLNLDIGMVSMGLLKVGLVNFRGLFKKGKYENEDNLCSVIYIAVGVLRGEYS